jgi:signal transduction histidine kinase
MRSVRWRLGVALAATAFFSVAITAAVAAQLLRSNAETSARSELQRAARAIARDPGVIGDERIGARALNVLYSVNQVSVALVAPGGASRGTGDGVTVASVVDLGTVFGGSAARGTARVTGRDYAYYAVPALIGGVVGAVVLTRPVDFGRARASAILARLLLAAMAAVLVAFAMSAYVSDRMTRSVRDVSEAAQRIARGDLTQEVPVESDDEVGELARTFNEMSLALSEAQRREREFVASVSHELRTPITAIRGYAEAIEDRAVHGEKGRAEAIGIIKAEAERLDRMVQDVMDLARLGSREFHLDVRAADLAATVRDAVAAHGREAEEAEVALEVNAPASLVAETDPDRVRQVVSNLVQNALRVTPAGGRVEVRARTDDGRALVEVSDTGPGIAPEDLPHVFERTYLWRSSKGRVPVGTGLGLAIVRELVVALGGKIDVESTLGSGTTFRISLPVPDA